MTVQHKEIETFLCVKIPTLKTHYSEFWKGPENKRNFTHPNFTSGSVSLSIKIIGKK